jgi:uncharacterized protein (TIGR02588 family)
MAREKAAQPGSDEEHGEYIPPLEWAVAIIGLLLVVGAVGFLIYEGVWGDHSPPDIVLETATVEQRETGYLVIFKAANDGGSTAADLQIEGELLDGETVLETSSATLDYLPANSEREGGLFFTNDPNRYTLRLRPLGYQTP